MNKVDLVDVVYCAHGGISRQEASELVDTILGYVKSSLGKERRMHVSGFGSFQVVRRGARVGRNPHTGQPLELAERRTLVFRPARVVMDQLNAARPEPDERTEPTEIVELSEPRAVSAGGPAIRILMD